MGLTRQAYHQKKRREERKRREKEKVLFLVRMIRRDHTRMGGRKLLVKLQPFLRQEGIRLGRDRLYMWLREEDLLVPARRSRIRTTQPGSQAFSNLLEGYLISGPDDAWVADITYLPVDGEYRYLFVVMDVYSRKIVGWQLGSHLGAEYALDALRMAVEQACVKRGGTVHHSDHGVQYTCRRYREYLEAHGIKASMGKKGYVYHNAYVERVIGTLKEEYGLGKGFPDVSSLRRAVEETIWLYNTDRPHQALGYATPEDVYTGKVLIPPFEAIKTSGRLP
jgi:Transposase and inactivated derivatives